MDAGCPCRPYLGDYRHRVDTFVPECTDSRSCRCHVCLRKPPSLRSLASYTLFHITNNFSEFTLSSETLYDHYLRAAKSKTVPVDRLIPDSFLICALLMRGDHAVSICGITKLALIPSNSPGTLTPGNNVIRWRRLSLAFAWKRMNGGVIGAVNRSSLLQIVCYAGLFVCNKYRITSLFYYLEGLSRHVYVNISDYGKFLLWWYVVDVTLASLYAINTVLPHCFIISKASPDTCT